MQMFVGNADTLAGWWDHGLELVQPGPRKLPEFLHLSILRYPQRRNTFCRGMQFLPFPICRPRSITLLHRLRAGDYRVYPVQCSKSKYFFSVEWVGPPIKSFKGRAHVARGFLQALLQFATSKLDPDRR